MYVIEGAVEDSVDDDDADDDDGGIMCTASMRAENTIIIPATYYENYIFTFLIIAILNNV